MSAPGSVMQEVRDIDAFDFLRDGTCYVCLQYSEINGVTLTTVPLNEYECGLYATFSVVL